MAETNQKAANVCIRVPMGLKEQIDRDVKESREFNSASQWYIAAIREYLKIRENERDRIGGGGSSNN